MTFEIREVTGLKDCFAVRKAVFVEEQGIDIELDFDGEDEACLQYVAYEDETAIATVRVKTLPNNVAKVQRLAVLKSQRGKGIGQEMMFFLLEDLAAKGFVEIILGAQTHANNFYIRLGFEPYGDEFKDAGLPHQMMRIALRENLKQAI